MKKTITKITSIALSATTVIWLSGAAALMPVAYADEISDLQVLIQQLTAQLSALQGTPSAPVASPVAVSGSCNFTRSLTMGMSGDDVKCLQRYLNSSSDTMVASSGVGSPGNESMYFGSLTKAAAVKWQNKYAAGVLAPVGLSSGTGYWGPSSISYYKSMMASAPPVVGGPAPTVPVVPASGLALRLAANNPPSANVPQGAAEVPYVVFTVSGYGTLNSLTFKRVGLGATSDFISGGVKLYEGSVRLTTGKTVNSTTHEVSFPSLSFKVNGSRTFALAADMSATATGGDINAFDLTAASGDVAVSGVPLKGNQMVVAGATVGSVTVAKTGSVSNPVVGAGQALLSQFKLTAGSTEDIQVKRVVLTSGGNITSSNLSNLVLKQAGDVVATSAGVSGRDLYVFDFAQPFDILKGQVKTFDVYGDVSPLSKKSDTIKLYVDVSNDVFATGKTYGYGVTVTSTAFDSDAADHHVLTLQGADVTLTFHGPVTRDIPAKAQDVTFFEFSIASKNNIEVRKLVFTPTVTNLTSGEGFNDFKVVDVATGSAVTSSSDITASTAVTFTDVFNIAAGETRRFKATADVDPDNDASDTMKIQLDQIGASDIKNLDNNTFVAQADIVPNNAIVGNVQTVKTVSLDVALSGTPASHNTVKGTDSEDLAGFVLTARNGDVKVTSMTVTASAASGTAAGLRNDLRTIGLYVNDGLVSEKKNFTSSGTVSVAAFNQISYLIPEGQSAKVVVKADQIATDATGSAEYFAYLADLSTDLTAVDVEGNTLSLTGNSNSSGSVKVTVTTPTLRVDKVTDQETEAGLLVANGERVLAKFDFFAANADSKVTKLKVGVNTAASAATTTALNEEVREIRLYDGSTLLVSGVPEGSGAHAGSVRFENVNGLLTVPSNTTKQIQVKALLADVTGVTGGASTGTNVAAYVSDGQFEAVAGNTTLTTLTGSAAAGNLKRIYKTIPTITTSSPSSKTLVAGEVEALKFTVAANSNGDVEVARFEFNTSLSNATLTVNTITVRSGGSDVTLATKTIATTGGEGVVSFTTPERIAAGTSKTYSLFLDVASVAGSTTSASLSTKLIRDETGYVTAAGKVATENTATNSFVWSDRGVLPHSVTAADWHNGFNVKTLPSGAEALSK